MDFPVVIPFFSAVSVKKLKSDCRKLKQSVLITLLTNEMSIGIRYIGTVYFQISTPGCMNIRLWASDTRGLESVVNVFLKLAAPKLRCKSASACAGRPVVDQGKTIIFAR